MKNTAFIFTALLLPAAKTPVKSATPLTAAVPPKHIRYGKSPQRICLVVCFY
ncbi:MAG: hypothetical protein K2I05_08595 [Mailhella sp.]|nr:hypothetical protein [Mailhella sp.]